MTELELVGSDVTELYPCRCGATLTATAGAYLDCCRRAGLLNRVLLEAAELWPTVVLTPTESGWVLEVGDAELAAEVLAGAPLA